MTTRQRVIAFGLDHLVWFILLVVLAGFSLTIENFFQFGIFENIARQATFVGILSVGLSLAVLTGHMDLSVESVAGLSALLAAYLVGMKGAGRGLPISVESTLLISLGCGALIGLLNGVLVVYVQINAFIVTLATYIGARGLGLVLTRGGNVYMLPEGFERLANAECLGVPVLVLILVETYLLFHFILTRTRWGRHVYLVGGNASAAFRSGITVKRLLVTVFVLSGALAALSGWLLAARHNSATENMGVGMLFEAFAAVVIGGVSLKGGEGRLSGVLAGVLLLSAIQTAITVMDVPVYYMHVIRAGLVLFAVLLDSMKRAIRRRFL